jgi:hypothetical protein
MLVLNPSHPLQHDAFLVRWTNLKNGMVYSDYVRIANTLAQPFGPEF